VFDVKAVYLSSMFYFLGIIDVSNFDIISYDRCNGELFTMLLPSFDMIFNFRIFYYYVLGIVVMLGPCIITILLKWITISSVVYFASSLLD